ncbi:MAG: hypothetical protein AAGA68_16885 [Pseudomonadota bacterium]
MFDLDLDNTLSTNDRVAAVHFLSPDATAAAPQTTIQVRFGNGVHRQVIELEVRDLQPGVTYTRGLTVSSAALDPVTWTLSLRQPSPRADLEVDGPTITLDLTLGEASEHSVALFEKTGDTAAEGIIVRRADDALGTGTIDLQRHVAFSLDGKEVPGMTAWPEPEAELAELRQIPVDGKRALGIQLSDLPRGEHRVRLQLDATNAAPDSAPTIDLKVTVRHPLLAAVSILLVGIMTSLLITQGFVNWRNRNALRDRVHKLQRDWLHELRHLTAVIWLKAHRKRTELVVDKFALLPAPQYLASLLDSAARLLGLLKRYRELQHQIERAAVVYIEKYRLRQDLDLVLRETGPDNLDSEAAATIGARFDQLAQYLVDPARPRYLRLVDESRRRALNSFVASALQATETQQEHLQQLFDEYVSKELPADANGEALVRVDEVSSSLRVLWRQRNDDAVRGDLLQLIARASASEIDVDKVFDVSNARQFEKLSAAFEAREVRIEASGGAPRGQEVEHLRPTRFELIPADPTLQEDFFFCNKVSAEWRFTLHSARGAGAGGRDEKLKWTERAEGNTVVQFSPKRGTLEIEVVFRYGDQQSEPISTKVKVAASKSAGLRARLLETQETVITLVAVVVALASGLSLYYWANPSFGSVQDYLALFTWAVGVDQGKNVAQAAQSLRQQAGAAEPWR